MFRAGEGAFLCFLDVVGEGLLHEGSDVGELLGEFRRKVAEQGQHVLINQDLAVAVDAGTDAEGRDAQGCRNELGKLGRYAFEDDGKGSGRFDSLGFFDELAGRFFALALYFKSA